ncbi:hypothetical protein KFE25_011501 [Diacronema lutheri]|uniref:Uncharacterized protein n=1 Tax=Diacronema lutheri TaxID=2081491 RepID=A0A8J6C8M3_DIALT|nr:hypothetical protein KFE25_011501 [Diacronema lutheri]
MESLGDVRARLPKGSAYDFSTTRNLLCQLYSLMRVTRLWLPRAHLLHAVIYLRPDLQVLDPIDVVALAGVQDRELYVPFWHCWSGLNDRFAFARPSAAAVYGQRLLALERFVQERRLQSESLLLAAVREAGITAAFTSSMSVRVRTTGRVEVLARCTPRDTDPGCVKMSCNVGAASGVAAARNATDHCTYVPEYGARRRQVLLVLYGRRLAMAARIEQYVLEPLRRACVVFSVVANLHVDDAAAWATNASMRDARARVLMSPVPLSDLIVSPPPPPPAPAENATAPGLLTTATSSQGGD